MSNLYQLTGEYTRLLELADTDDGSDETFSEALATTMSVGGEQIEEKLENTLYVARSLEADAEACAAEAKRLSERAGRLRANAESCKGRVMQAMTDLGMDKVKRPLMSFTRVKGRQVCQVVDEAAVPEQYVKRKEVASVDKAAILKALKAGEEVAGCGLGEGKPSLRIS